MAPPAPAHGKRKRGAPAQENVSNTIDLTGDNSDDSDDLFETLTHPVKAAKRDANARPSASAPRSYAPLPTPPTSSLPMSSATFDGQHSERERQSWLSQPPPATQFASTQGGETWNDDDLNEIIAATQQFESLDSLTHYGDLSCKVNGIRYYKGYAEPGEYINLRREPGNPYDANAIRVDNIAASQIGHIEKKIAAKIAKYIDNGWLHIDATLSGYPDTFSVPMTISMYGPDPTSRAGKDLVAKMTADKLPIKAIKEAEKREQARQKQLDKARKEAEKQAKRAAGASRAAGAGGSSQIPPSTQGFTAFAGPSAPGPSSQFDVLSAGERFNPREVDQVSEKFGLTEEALKELPTTAQPDCVETQMLPYQLQALKWLLDHEDPKLPTTQGSDNAVQLWSKKGTNTYTNLVTKHTTNEPYLASGGILADDMGLGKTLEMISLIVADAEKFGRGTTLIVAPLSVMSNWSGQIAHHIRKDKALKVYTFHGPKRGRMRKEDFEQFDVVITTYQTLANEYMPKKGAGKSNGDIPKKELRATGLYSMDWRRIILDEGHTIRTPRTKVSLAVTALTARSRWVLTGTPIVNSLLDLYSLLRFVGVQGLDQLECFNQCLMRPLKAGDPAGTKLLQAVMSATSLRRKKEMAFIDLKLPELEEFVQRIDFSKKEQERYDVLQEEAQGMAERVEKSVSAQKRFAAYNHLLTLLLRMRQCCNHFKLCGEGVAEMMAQLEEAKTVPRTPENVKALQDVLQLQIESQEDCPICFEPIAKDGEPVITTCCHTFCRQCATRFVAEQHKCPMCRAELKDEDCLVAPKVEAGDQEPEDDLDINESSSKLERLMLILSQTKDAGDGQKTVIFSQWTRFLDIVQARLDREGYRYCRIDGTMNAGKRDDALEALDSDPEYTIMLASLGVCAVGLNLTAANQVILSDTWWNPSCEDQATDRVHRLGQKRKTRVIRLVIDKTVEDRTLEIQAEKRKLMKLAFGEKKNKRDNVKTSRLADIQRLLAGPSRETTAGGETGGGGREVGSSDA